MNLRLGLNLFISGSIRGIDQLVFRRPSGHRQGHGHFYALMIKYLLIGATRTGGTMECSSNLVTARVIVINVLPDRGIDTDLAARKWKKINYSGTWTSFKFVRINIIFFL